MRADYERRLRKVLQHIFDHPDGDLSVETLSRIAGMSSHNWHRVFQGMTGESCAQAVRRLRAHRAAVWLVRTDWTVDQIARRVGYDDTEFFGRQFRAQYGLTPRAFREAGRPGPVSLMTRHEEPREYAVEVTDLPERRLASLFFEGSYDDIWLGFEVLDEILRHGPQRPGDPQRCGVYYHDPDVTPRGGLRSSLAVVVDADYAMPPELDEVILPAGRHAVLTRRGPHDRIRSAYDYLFGFWLPDSGEDVADAPPMEFYHPPRVDMTSSALVTEICVRLKEPVHLHGIVGAGTEEA